MTEIRARVRRRFEVHPLGYDRHAEPWIASVSMDGQIRWHSLTPAASWPEAMQAAYKMLADLDAELMNEVHASRATRRTERCWVCDRPIAPGTRHAIVGGRQCTLVAA